MGTVRSLFSLMMVNRPLPTLAFSLWWARSDAVSLSWTDLHWVCSSVIAVCLEELELEYLSNWPDWDLTCERKQYNYIRHKKTDTYKCREMHKVINWTKIKKWKLTELNRATHTNLGQTYSRQHKTRKCFTRLNLSIQSLWLSIMVYNVYNGAWSYLIF